MNILNSVLFFLLPLCSIISGTEIFETGDLIFQYEGKSDFSKAISVSTGDEDSLNFVHVGIIEITGDSINVIEASPESGVRVIKLEEFLKKAPLNDGKPGIVVKRLELDFPVFQAIGKAKSHIGEPYDWWYLPDNGKTYCSELVYESYETEEGEKIFNAVPMNFLAPDGTLPDFWKELFKKLGSEVPQGVPGTNPNRIASDSRLKHIYP